MQLSNSPRRSRPFGQTVILFALVISAALSLALSLFLGPLLLSETLRLDFNLAFIISLNPSLGLASAVAPIFMYRRSALGLILAWVIAGVLLVDAGLELFGALSHGFLILKAMASVGLSGLLFTFLFMRSTYEDLNPKSYGFPVLARTVGLSAPGFDSVPQGMTDTGTEPASQFSGSPFPKVTLMHAFTRAVSTLRTVAWISRIVALVLLAINLAWILWMLMRVFGRIYSASSFYGGGFSGRQYPWEEFGMLLGPPLVVFVLLLVLFTCSFLLSGLAELINVQVFVASTARSTGVGGAVADKAS